MTLTLCGKITTRLRPDRCFATPVPIGEPGTLELPDAFMLGYHVRPLEGMSSHARSSDHWHCHARSGSRPARELHPARGPTAVYLGGELKQLTEAQVERLRRISSSAERKAGSRLKKNGTVNSRVFKKIIDDGYLCTDTLSADYYGGFLASARTADGKDDTNVFFTSMINQMSSDQLHGHWILYSMLLNRMYGRTDLNLYLSKDRRKTALYIPWRSFMFLFEKLRTDEIESSNPKFTFSGADRSHSVTLDDKLTRELKTLVDCAPFGGFDYRRLDIVLWGLLNNRLVDHLYWGSTRWDLVDQMHKDYPSDPLAIAFSREQASRRAEQILKVDPDDQLPDRWWEDAQGGVVFHPSILGIDLFLRAQGLPPDDTISFQCLSYGFNPELFREQIMKNVRLVDPSESGG
jgi:hypothetical protein